MLQAGEGAQHAARAHDAGGAQQLGLHFVAAGLQLLGQLFQTQQLGSALHRALGGQLCGFGGFGRVELGDLGSMLCSFAGLIGLGTDGGQRFTQGTLFRCGLAGLGGGKLELQALLVQLLVGIQGGGAQQLGHGIADGMDAVGQLFHGVQCLGQTGGGKGRNDHVCRIDRIEHAHDDKANKGRDHIHKTGDDRVDDAHDHQRAHAPQQAELQADVAANVEGKVAVVPPAGVIELIQCPAAHQLQRTGQDDAADVQQQDAALQRSQGEQHDDHAEAVNGAHRAVEKAAVHQLTGGGGGKDDLQTPAGAGINEEECQHMVQRKAAHCGGREKVEHKAPPMRIMLLRRSVLFLYDLVFIARLKERAGSRAAGKIAGHLVLVQTAALSTVPAAVLVLHIVQADLAGVIHCLRLPVQPGLRPRRLRGPDA